MIFNHEHQHPPSTTRAQAPWWAPAAFAASLLLVAVLVLGGFR